MAWHFFMIVISASCRTRRAVPKIVRYDRPLPPGQLALRKITDPNRFPDFTQGWRDLDSLQAAIRKSQSYLGKPSSKQYFPYGDINYDRAVKTLDTFLTMLDSDARSDEINGLVRAHFDVYESVGWDDRGTVLFTGYYTPIFDGSFTADLAIPVPAVQSPG